MHSYVCTRWQDEGATYTNSPSHGTDGLWLRRCNP